MVFAMSWEYIVIIILLSILILMTSLDIYAQFKTQKLLKENNNEKNSFSQ